VDVAEGDDLGVAVDDVGRQLAGNDAFEQCGHGARLIRRRPGGKSPLGFIRAPRSQRLFLRRWHELRSGRLVVMNQWPLLERRSCE